jgi:hypothetical protein
MIHSKQRKEKDVSLGVDSFNRSVPFSSPYRKHFTPSESAPDFYKEISLYPLDLFACFRSDSCLQIFSVGWWSVTLMTVFVYP